ncbi:capsular exopolysaccharide synthesis family protein [Microbacterium keratanolyticum]|uniref:non-specific protein-tyrosine kinase n=2 Tax=Microbacterium keratanolyticum TaxID=67574 RepID=A0A9W6HT13_9MICO|nr:polysaccharide biosynthesis tyrosine autokinase [Microbacterium keratanolyticum]MBM7469482.1 capsular exopolysaccharide synthesis family protein [Microbacterium keratanolyticum]GLK01561.1 chromosome partitioning protein [Microbacterium keratanolyticum]
MELRDYVRVLHRNWVLLLVFLAVGAGVGAAIGLTTPAKYESATKIYVSVRTDSAATGDLVQATTFARQVVTSYVEVATTGLVLDPVIEALDLRTSAAALAKQVTVSSAPNTVIISIRVADGSPEQASKIADAVAGSLITAVETTLEPPAVEGGQSAVQLRVVQSAPIPPRPASPNIPLLIALGAFLGLAAGVGAAMLRTMMDTRIHSLNDIEQITDAPVLGGISFDPGARERPLIVHADPRSPRAESFRTLRTNLQFVGVNGEPRAFVVTSSGPGEGKSTTTANLAIALAQLGARVALVDGDLRLPRVASYMDVDGTIGLTDVLVGRVELADALQKWGTGKLFVLPAGTLPPNPSELLGSAAMDHVLNSLTKHFDYVLFDAPPLLLVTDAALVAKKTQGAIMVAASGRTKKQQLEAAVRTLETAGGPLVGVVVTMLPEKGPDSSGYGQYGQYGTALVDADA